MSGTVDVSAKVRLVAVAFLNLRVGSYYSTFMSHYALDCVSIGQVSPCASGHCDKTARPSGNPRMVTLDVIVPVLLPMD